MVKRTLFILLLIGLAALTGCHTGARSSVRADYYSGGRYAPYYYYDPFYPRYFYDPYPSFFFGSSFFYGYPYFFPHNFIVIDRGHRGIAPGSRSLRGFRGGPGVGHGMTGGGGHGGGRSGGSGGSRGGRRLR